MRHLAYVRIEAVTIRRAAIKNFNGEDAEALAEIHREESFFPFGRPIPLRYFAKNSAAFAFKADDDAGPDPNLENSS